MYNWSTNVKAFAGDKQKLAVWQLEQLINFGLGKSKIKASLLKKHWSKLHIDPSRKAYLKFLLDEK